tara:strand:- start:25198 stop:25599 length:402 start_codon:yes stop_codon:yes gene_type:complete
MATRPSTNILQNTGALNEVLKKFGSLNPTASALANIQKTVREYINGPRYEVIKGIFQKHISSDSLCDAYTLLCLDAMKKFEANFDDLFTGRDTEISFSELGITLLNNYRPSTSQIGRAVPITPTQFVGRHIIQ